MKDILFLLAVFLALLLCPINTSASDESINVEPAGLGNPCGPAYVEPKMRPALVVAKARTCRELILWYKVANKKALAWPNRPVVMRIHPKFCPTM
jgi:hypothetical protein